MTLEELNQLSASDAESRFRDCCGSHRWAREMEAARPFVSEASLIDRAEKFWWNLNEKDRHEAFSAHPKIGENKAEAKQEKRAADWSAGEQAGLNAAGANTKEKLAEANRLYLDKFGYIFIVCATGKSAEEMLEICRQRLENAAENELSVAAEEQRKITEIRLRKLLGE